jgi:hypothetical protein
MSALGGNPDGICSQRAFPLLTPEKTNAALDVAMHICRASKGAHPLISKFSKDLRLDDTH